MDVMSIRRSLFGMIGGGKILKIEAGTYTPATDEFSRDVHIAHTLGVTPDFVIAMADAFEAVASMTNSYIANAFFSKTNFIASNFTDTYAGFYIKNWTGRDTVTTSYENLSTSKFLHENNFEIPYYNTNDTLKAGITYHYVVGIYE